jgi:transcriptional antiterminator NusG
MTDENTQKPDEKPPLEPAPVEASNTTPADEAVPAPVSLTPPEPVEGGPATGAAPETPPIADLAPAEPVPIVADTTQAEVTAEEPDAEAGPESPASTSAEQAVPDTEVPAPEAPSEPAVPAEQPKPKPRKPRKSKAAAAETDAGAGDIATATATAVAAEPGTDSKKKWYAVKVQSGREESIKAAIERKVKIENLEQYFGQIVIPVEEVNEKKKVKVKVKDKKTGEVETTTQERNVVKKHKKFPGYIFAEVEFNDEILYVFRETSGVGDFVGIPARRGQSGERLAPTPMTEAEVQSMRTGVPVGDPRKGVKKTVVKLDYEKGDKVRIKNGAFAGHEAEVKSITEAKDPTDSPKVTVVVTMWGRPVDVELDHWEVDKA